MDAKLLVFADLRAGANSKSPLSMVRFGRDVWLLSVTIRCPALDSVIVFSTVGAACHCPLPA